MLRRFCRELLYLVAAYVLSQSTISVVAWCLLVLGQLDQPVKMLNQNWWLYVLATAFTYPILRKLSSSRAKKDATLIKSVLARQCITSDEEYYLLEKVSSETYSEEDVQLALNLRAEYEPQY